MDDDIILYLFAINQCYMPIHWKDATVTQIIQETPNTRRFYLKTDGSEGNDFIPGQFITLDLPIGEKRRDRWRSYSIANAPGQEHMELCVVRLREGRGTRYLFEEIEVGSSLRYKGPEGVFTTPRDLDRELIMVCTGTGVAPFRAMIQDIMNQKKKYKRIHLVFGTRRKEDILYHEEFSHLAKAEDNFQYDVMLSREEYNGRQGYVHEVYMDAYRVTDPSRLFLLCGWSAMIDEAVVNLAEQCGYEKSQIRYELYG